MNALKNYPPKLFHSSNIDDALKIAGQFKFASIYTTDEDCDIVLAPLYHLYEQNNKKEFYGHFVRSNPFFQLLKSKGEIPCRMLFNAADTYISPTCYKAKQITQNVVPTWNYVAAQFKGVMKLVPDQNLYSLLEKEVELFQKSAQSDWKLSDATPQYVNQLSKSIFGVKIELISWKAHMKLSQNKSDEIQNIRKWCEYRQSQKKSILSWMDDFK